MKKSQKRLQLNTNTVRNLSGIELKNAHGGVGALSAPTDEMGQCSNCNTVGCHPSLNDCWPDPQM